MIEYVLLLEGAIFAFTLSQLLFFLFKKGACLVVFALTSETKASGRLVGNLSLRSPPLTRECAIDFSGTKGANLPAKGGEKPGGF